MAFARKFQNGEIVCVSPEQTIYLKEALSGFKPWLKEVDLLVGKVKQFDSSDNTYQIDFAYQRLGTSRTIWIRGEDFSIFTETNEFYTQVLIDMDAFGADDT